MQNQAEEIQTYHVEIGETYWFEYHCWEDSRSTDADLWYHSHQKVIVKEMCEPGLGIDFANRAECGSQALYTVIFSDGFEKEAFEDELLESMDDFCCDDPPEEPKKNED